MLLTDQLDRMENTGWEPFFCKEISKPYFTELDAFVSKQAEHTVIYPAPENIFAAFAACPPQDICAVILGQDPYHEENQAMGLAFSVPNGCEAKFPPSLRNIFKELQSEYGADAAKSTDLTPWAKQGVFLLNTVLTVEHGHANAHAGHGWETFTRAALEYAVQQSSAPLAAVLWGKPAQSYASIFEGVRPKRPVLILESAHPSPLSAYRGFWGSAPFGKVNAFLQKNGVSAINWTLN